MKTRTAPYVPDGADEYEGWEPLEDASCDAIFLV